MLTENLESMYPTCHCAERAIEGAYVMLLLGKFQLRDFPHAFLYSLSLLTPLCNVSGSQTLYFYVCVFLLHLFIVVLCVCRRLEQQIVIRRCSSAEEMKFRREIDALKKSKERLV
jgi:hypothetical protein